MRKFAIAGGLVLAGAMSAHAADLIVDDAAAPMDTSLVNSSIYVQLLGGAVLSGDVDFYYDDDQYLGTSAFEAGYAIAGTVGVVVMDGLSVEADAMYTKRDYESSSDYNVSSASIMGNLKYTVPLNDMFSVYGAAGLGFIGYQFPDSTPDSYGGLGYQLIAGVGAKLTDNITAIAEYRYQNTFDLAPDSDDYDYGIQAPTSTVLVGVKLGF
ncbi:outer membrane protein [Devosia sp.]|uniref:outer membrane protein n=1 Tax=Devosia sp. TaxID=1871048 RepID=UPI003BA85727